MQSGLRTNRLRFRVKDSYLNIAMKMVIAVLCVYIAIHSINIITHNQAKENAAKAVKTSSNVFVNEIIDNTGIITQYMMYMENHGDLTDEMKKKVLESVITEYISGSEYTYDTSDPGYVQVVDLIYNSINTQAPIQEETTKTPETTKAEEKKKKEEKKQLVPTPKSVGTKYTKKKLGEFDDVINKFYVVTKATSIKESDMPIDKAINTKFKIKGDNKKPQILIYHTHSQEEFSNSRSNDKSTTVIGIGDRLAKVLKEQFGYNVLHDTSKYDIVNGKLDRSAAYDQARVGVKKTLKDNPSISLVLDIHRDGVNKDVHLSTKINGKPTANVMFFNGISRFRESGDIDYLYNPYLFENLALSFQMKMAAEEYYPDFARKNYINAYKYNLDLCKQCMLIEVGAQTNTYQEAVNAADPLAVLIDKVMGKSNNK